MTFNKVRPSFFGDNCDCGGFFVFDGEEVVDGKKVNVFKCGTCNRKERW